MQVNKLRIIFIPASNNPLVNDEIRTLEQSSHQRKYFFRPFSIHRIRILSALTDHSASTKEEILPVTPKMKTMKTLVTLKQNLRKPVLFFFVSALSLIAKASPSSVSTPPVKLASFTAVLNNSNTNKVDLKWSTETESNLNHIMVERSTDGINFSDAALVFTYGNTTAKSDYSFADNISKVKAAVIYYRLRSVDVDGTTQVSAIQVINLK